MDYGQILASIMGGPSGSSFGGNPVMGMKPLQYGGMAPGSSGGIPMGGGDMTSGGGMAPGSSGGIPMGGGMQSGGGQNMSGGFGGQISQMPMSGGAMQSGGGQNTSGGFGGQLSQMPTFMGNLQRMFPQAFGGAMPMPKMNGMGGAGYGQPNQPSPYPSMGQINGGTWQNGQGAMLSRPDPMAPAPYGQTPPQLGPANRTPVMPVGQQPINFGQQLYGRLMGNGGMAY